MNSNTAIELNNVQFSWSDETILLINNWQLAAGKRCFIYGRSGSGKSTLLNIIAGILRPQQGHVSINGTDITQLSAHQRDHFRATQMGVIFQQFNLLPYLSVANNIKLSQFFSKTTQDKNHLLQLLDALELSSSLLDKPAEQLSVGQQQRVAVARALIHRPSLIIADEPTSALDEETRNRFMQQLLEQCEQTQSTLLFVSHDRTLATHFDQQLNLHELNQAEANHAI